MNRRSIVLVLFLGMLAACTDNSSWRNDPTVVAARDACKSGSGVDYNCIEGQAVTALNPEICRLAGIGIDDMCLQAVYEAARDPSICDRIYLRGVVPNCRAYYAPPSPSQDLSAFYGNRPPAAILIAGEQEQVAGVGTSTWTLEKKGQEQTTVHGDAFALVTPAEALAVPASFTAILRLPIPATPSTLWYALKPVTDDISRSSSQGATSWQVAFEQPGTSLDLKPEQEISLSLEPGQYLLEVYASWQELGSADYGFFLEVQAKTALSTQTPSPEPLMNIPVTDEIVLTIRNDQPYSGRVGEPRPDWVGWGAQAFSMAPNGDIWILDSAAQPQRLLRFGKPYERTQFISLEGLVVGAADVEAASDAIWVLGIASQPPRVVKLSTNGKPLESYDLPKGLWPEDGLTGIALAQDGALIVELAGGADLYQLFDQNGQIDPRRLEGYTFDNRLFRVSTTTLSKNAIIYAGDVTTKISSQQPIGGLRVLGSAPDGSFYAEMYVMPEELGSTSVREILCYSPAGLLLGIAYPHPAEFYAEQNVVVGPDGLVYQLVSNPDHSVQIVRMGFKTGESALAVPTASPSQTTTPLTPLLPTWTVTPVWASDLDLARHTLLTFFTLLHEGRYAEATSLYGGAYDVMREQNPDIPTDDYAGLWKAACSHQSPCLLVSRIVEEDPISQDEFEFVVEFVWLDGMLFKLGPCCGATEAEMPPVWQFPYTVKKIDGQFKVMEGPVYVP